jgi:pimeloyl-ACP methyl ester carboxylesterase/DNA-binding CsgD family transcriptional regulator
LIDALLSYAVDPVRWEGLAGELETHRRELAELEPSALLAALSQAEALAWQLKGQPEADLQQSGCTYFLLDCHGGVLQHSPGAEDVCDYCWADNGRLRFAAPASEQSYRNAVQLLQTESQDQVLVELQGKNPFARYGYLVHAEGLPAALNLQNQNICCGLLIARADSPAQIRRVLQSSFGLSAAELAICQHLHAGLQLKEVAQKLDISPNTARNQLQSIFDKTNVNRQSDLLLMMTQLSVILSVISGREEEQRANANDASYPPHRFIIAPGSGEPRRIAFRQYGSGCRHVVYFHESFGTSRLLPGCHDLASELGLTITAFERPGSGFSDEQRAYDFNSIALDVERLLQELQIERVSLLGYVSGAAHALAAAAHLGHRVERVMLVSGRGTRGLSYRESSALASLRRHLTAQPWMLTTFFNILRSRANRDTNRRLLLRVYGSVEHDRTYLTRHPEILDHMVDYTLEAITRTGAGIAAEIRCFTNPAQVDLAKIRAPITAWHGAADKVAEFASLQRELQGLRVEQKLFANSGSMVVYEHWEDILRFLAAPQNDD